ncbi:hypothetical protein TorRG33x02_200190 [Trema orientale]|uniref:Uncharacterized protein n=1 Tax=Trema orientale TaxID=63057 RepID=A0A2P5EFF1_TREOI|nr:hypothetical protein TorRG33x02_200190 [Trema orientale]
MFLGQSSAAKIVLIPTVDAEVGGGGVDLGVEIELSSVEDLVAGHATELLDDEGEGGGGADLGVEVELSSVEDLVAGHAAKLLDDEGEVGRERCEEVAHGGGQVGPELVPDDLGHRGLHQHYRRC